jgi:uncharacterized protein
MNTVDYESKNKPWHKEHYVWMIIFFPVLAIVGGIVTIYLAVTSNDGLVVDDYYKEGLEINRTLERDDVALDYQLQAEIDLDKSIDEVILKLSAVSGFTYPEKLSVSFLHSTRAGLDRMVNMILTIDGIYRGNLSDLEKGKWYVYIQHDNWRLVKTINVNN